MASNGQLPWWIGVGRSGGERRLTREQRLERIGICEDEFETYKRLFLACRRPDKYSVRRSDGSWPQVTHPWNDSLILRHLCGDDNVAISFADSVNQIVLDIDYKGGRGWREVEETVRLATRALPGEPLVYQSSISSGIRMIWFLKGRVSRSALYVWTEKALTKAGVTVQSGKCEVRLGEVPDRLPFGLHSMLLDSITLDPEYNLTLSQTLRIAVEHRGHHANEPPTLLQADYGSKKERYRSIVAACLCTGLPADVSTNECLLKLAWHGRKRLRLSDDELKPYLKNWITNCHNGHSDRVNKGNIDLVYRQIDRIVRGFMGAPAVSCSASVEPLGLTETELYSLLDFPGDFKSLRALFKLLCHTKGGFLSSHSGRTVDSALLRRKRGNNKWGKVSSQNEGITNGAKNFQPSIDLPKLFLRHLKVPNANNTARWIREMERTGVLQKKRESWPDGHKARQYWVNFPFDLTGQPLSGSFDEVLWTVVGFDGIGDRFTRYQAERIAEVVGFQRREKPVAVHRPDVKKVQSDSTART